MFGVTQTESALKNVDALGPNSQNKWHEMGAYPKLHHRKLGCRWLGDASRSCTSCDDEIGQSSSADNTAIFLRRQPTHHFAHIGVIENALSGADACSVRTSNERNSGNASQCLEFRRKLNENESTNTQPQTRVQMARRCLAQLHLV